MAKKIEDYIQYFHDYGIYVPTRTVWIDGEITPELRKQVITNLLSLDSTVGTINLLITSTGGSVDDGMAIYDIIKGLGNYVRGLVSGYCDSMGTVILQACDERLITESSRLMIHLGSPASAESHHHNDKKAWEEYFAIQAQQADDKLLYRMKEKKPRFSRKNLKDLMLFDKIFLPKEAVEIGLVDIIKNSLEGK